MRHSRGPMPYATRGENRSQNAHNTTRQRAPAMYALVVAEHFGDLSDEWVPHYSLDLDAILATADDATADDAPAWEPYANAVSPSKHELYPETRVSDNSGNPYGSAEPSWFTAQLGDLPVSDNGPGTP